MVNVSVVIPALNPEMRLVEFVEKLLFFGISEVIVVNDGSNDSSRSCFDALDLIDGCTVLHNDINQGKGRALKTGFAYFIKSNELKNRAGIVTADCDGQHTARDVYRLAKRLQNHPDTMVVGQRDFSLKFIPKKECRKNKWVSRVFRIVYGADLRDVLCGCRAIPSEALTWMVEMKGERFEYEMNMLAEASRRQIPIASMNIDTVYNKRNLTKIGFAGFTNRLRILFYLLSSFLKYILVALLTYLLEISIFAVLINFVFQDQPPEIAIPACNVISWTANVSVTYFFNSRIFADKMDHKKGLFRYFISNVSTMMCSVALQYVTYILTGIDESILKAVYDNVMFYALYVLQSKWVYKK